MSSAIANGFSNQRICISVHHRLRPGIAIGEDIFAQRTETVVHQDPGRRCLGATYPLPISHVAYGTQMPKGVFKTGLSYRSLGMSEECL